MLACMFECVCLQPLNQEPVMATTSRRSSRGSASSDRSGHERRLYRQGSLGSQMGGSGISLSSRGNFSYKSRTPSGKSIRSRVASRAEYHQDLKPDLEQVCHIFSTSITMLIVSLPTFCNMTINSFCEWYLWELFYKIEEQVLKCLSVSSIGL